MNTNDTRPGTDADWDYDPEQAALDAGYSSRADYDAECDERAAVEEASHLAFAALTGRPPEGGWAWTRTDDQTAEYEAEAAAVVLAELEDDEENATLTEVEDLVRKLAELALTYRGADSASLARTVVAAAELAGS